MKKGNRIKPNVYSGGTVGCAGVVVWPRFWPPGLRKLVVPILEHFAGRRGELWIVGLGSAFRDFPCFVAADVAEHANDVHSVGAMGAHQVRERRDRRKECW